jgi:exo-1,4-beta-D-glucosaminidase
MEEINPQIPIVTTCRGVEVGGHQNTSEISGPSGVKMLGPYEWVSPNYWYVDSTYGGAYGFNTETGPGPQVPPIESIQKMLPEEHWWPIDTMWHYHCGRNEFGTLDRYLKAFNARYGEAHSLEEFTFKSQVSNYEAIRGMFEAFAVNKYRSTGVIQWMLNSAWPEMFWQLYDFYLRPNGAFYGTRKACAPLTAVYNYGDGNIYVVNESREKEEELTLKIRLIDNQSQILLSEEKELSIDPNTSVMAYKMPEVEDLTTTYYLDLRLEKSKKQKPFINFYWLSTKKDTHNFEGTTWLYTPPEKFADLTGINQLPEVEPEVKIRKTDKEDGISIECKIQNPSDHLAFFTEAKLLHKKDGNPVLPVFWNDNYISLLPGESRTIRATLQDTQNLQADDVKVEVKGVNVKRIVR